MLQTTQHQTNGSTQTLIGQPYASPCRWTNGFDEIDKEAERQGRAARGLRSMTPARSHVNTVAN